MGVYDVQPQVAGYGSVGAAGCRGLQQELLRRMELERQAQIDEQNRQAAALNAEKVRAQIETEQTNAASNEELRQATAEARRATATKAAQDEFIRTRRPGQVSPADLAEGQKLGLGHLFLTTPTPATPGNAESQDYEGQPAAEPTPAGQQTTYLGSPEQQDLERRRQFAQRVMDGEFDTGDENVDKYRRMQAEQFLTFGKEGSIPAGVINGPKSATETKSAHDLALEKILSKPRAAWTPDEAAMVAGREAFNKMQGAEAASRAAVVNVNTNTRESTKALEAAKTGSDRAVTQEMQKLRQDQERTERALRQLNDPNWLSDASLVPEYLQVMAGGMGSGLRMTIAELNNVQNAQSYLDQLKGKAGKLPFGEYLVGNTTIQPEARAQMKRAIQAVKDARDRQIKANAEFIRKLKDAKTADEVRDLQAHYWESAGDAPARPQGGVPTGVTVVREQN